MTDEIKEELTRAGIDLEDALGRVLGSESLLERILKKFLEDPNYERLRAGLASGDADQAFRAAHTLKGVCGNLSMGRLYQLTAQQVELLRGGDCAGAAAMLPAVTREYELLTDAIRRSFV